MKFLTIIFSLLFISTTTIAVDSNGNYAVWGVGKKSCIGYSRAAADNDIEKYNHYMYGFLTAYNIFTKNTYNITGKMNQNQILEWMNDYCEENPMSTLENALTSFTFDHFDKRRKTGGQSAGR